MSLVIEGITIDDPVNTLLWDGELADSSFIARVPMGAETGDRAGNARVRLGGILIARINLPDQDRRPLRPGCSA